MNDDPAPTNKENEINEDFQPERANIFPKGIKNIRCSCYANAVLQCLFNTKKFYQFFQTEKIEQELYDFIETYYNDSITDTKRGPDDTKSFLRLLKYLYPSLLNIFGIQFVELRNNEPIFESAPSINIDQEMTVNIGIQKRLEIDIPTDFHDIVIIKINRFCENQQNQVTYQPKSVKINKFIRIDEKDFQLSGIVYHNNNSPLGHFLSIIFQDNVVYFINNSNVSKNIPNKLNEDITKKADLLFNEKIDFDIRDYDDLIEINQLRKDLKNGQKEIKKRKKRKTIKKVSFYFCSMKILIN